MGGGAEEYERFGNKVTVDVNDVVTYGQEMMKLSAEGTGAGATALSEMPMLIAEALTMPLDGQVLPEGQQVARFLNQRMSDFQYFLKDVSEGLINIGSAAIVVAEIYEGADGENGATMNDIGFVFGDPDARPPSGFRSNYETVDEFNDRMAEQSGQNVQALTGDERYADVVSYPYGSIYTFGDGSQKSVHSALTYENGQMVSVTTTTITGPGGNVISSQTQKRYTTETGETTRNVTTTETGGRTTTSDTNYNSDGSITVRNQTNDQPATETTIDRDEHVGNDVEVPVGDEAERLETDGRPEVVEEYGRA